MSRDFSDRLLPILADLANTYGTPFHLYDAAGIAQTQRAMTRAFSGLPFRQYFAVKALPNPHILSLLLREGSGLDCSSLAELSLARQVGAVADDIVFTSNNTSSLEYDSALRAGALITFDDRSIFDKADPLPATVCFRVAPGGLAAGSDLMGDALNSKFGVPAAELVSAYHDARRRGATRFGIHGMICANELDMRRATEAAIAVMKLGSQISAAAGLRFDYINVGGGLGIPYRPDQEPLDLGEYANALGQALRRYFPGDSPKLMMECGRYVTGPHGVLVTRVINRCRKGRDLIGLDASMPALMRPGFYGAYHHVSVPFASGRVDAKFDVVGSLCENMDKFAIDRLLPDPREGDLVLIHDTGAHGHAMGFNYNGRLRPPELLLSAEGDVTEIRRAESFDDYIATVRWKPELVLKTIRETQGNAS